MRRRTDWIDVARVLIMISCFIALAVEITEITDPHARRALIWVCILLGYTSDRSSRRP